MPIGKLLLKPAIPFRHYSLSKGIGDQDPDRFDRCFQELNYSESNVSNQGEIPRASKARFQNIA
jgi:hypothetical protein